MKKKVYVNRPRRSHAWFDKECREIRQYVRKLLRKFRKTLAPTAGIAFCQTRREYKTLLHNKRKEYNQSLADK